MNKKSSQHLLNFSVCLILFILVGLGCNPKNLPGIRGKLKEWDEERTKDTERTIEKTPKLQELDSICKQVPVPADFKFIAKHLTWIVNQEPLISYFYYSKTDFDKAENNFRNYLITNGWESLKSDHLNKVNVFKKDNFKIHIQYGGVGSDANYSISCEKLKTIEQ
jgi:hypothetical protein